MNVNISNEFNNVSRKYQTSLSWVNQDLMLIFATCCGWLVARFRRGVCVCGWVGGWGGGSYGHHGWLPTYNHEMGHWLCLPEKNTQYYKHNLITFIVIILTVVPQNFIKYQFIDLSWYTKTSRNPRYCTILIAHADAISSWIQKTQWRPFTIQSRHLHGFTYFILLPFFLARAYSQFHNKISHNLRHEHVLNNKIGSKVPVAIFSLCRGCLKHEVAGGFLALHVFLASWILTLLLWSR